MFLFLIAISSFDSDITIGPDPGMTLPILKLQQATGEKAGQEYDLAEATKNGSSIIIFVHSEKWDRPIARFLREADQLISKEVKDNQVQRKIVIIWLTKDTEKAKSYLPKAQQSIKLAHSAWTIFEGESYDAKEWVLSGDVAINLILADNAKVKRGIGIKTVSEEVIRKVPEYLKK